MSAERFDAVARPEKVRMTERQLRRHDAFGEQPLRSVEIRPASASSSRARCARPASMSLPFVGSQQQRQRIERPGPDRRPCGSAYTL